MTKGKKIVAVAVCLAVVAGGTVGGTVIYRTQQTKKNRVDVLPVANLTQYWWGDDLSMDGQVVSGDVQNVTPSDDQTIAKVLVKEGDHVTKGTGGRGAGEPDPERIRTALPAAGQSLVIGERFRRNALSGSNPSLVTGLGAGFRTAATHSSGSSSSAACAGVPCQSFWVG